MTVRKEVLKTAGSLLRVAVIYTFLAPPAMSVVRTLAGVLHQGYPTLQTVAKAAQWLPAVVSSFPDDAASVKACTGRPGNVPMGLLYE